MEVATNSKNLTLGKRKAGGSGDSKEDVKRKPPVTLYNFGYAPKDVIEKFQHFCINYPTLTAAIESLLARDELLVSKYRFISSSVTYQMLARPTVKDDPAAIKAAILKLHKYAKDGRYKSVSDAIEELLMSTPNESEKNHLTNGGESGLSTKERAALEKISDAVYKKLKLTYQTDNTATDNLSASDNDDDEDGDDDFHPPAEEHHNESPPPMVTPGGKNSTSSNTFSDKPAGSPGSTVKTEPTDKTASSSGVSMNPARTVVGMPVTTTSLSATGKQTNNNAAYSQTDSSTTAQKVPAFVPRFQRASSASVNTKANQGTARLSRRKSVTPLKTPKVENVEMEGILFPSRSRTSTRKSGVATPHKLPATMLSNKSPGKRAASVRTASNKAMTLGERVSTNRSSPRAMLNKKTLCNNTEPSRLVQKKVARPSSGKRINGYCRVQQKASPMVMDKGALYNAGIKKRGSRVEPMQSAQFANAAEAVPADPEAGKEELKALLNEDGKVSPLLIPLSSYVESPTLMGSDLFAEMIKEKNKGDAKSRFLFEKCNLVAQSLVPEYHKENPLIHLTR